MPKARNDFTVTGSRHAVSVTVSHEPLRWYGVWLFVDWLEFSGAELDPTDAKQVAATAAVELEASRRDPYRQLSRVFHLVGRKGPS